MLFWIDTLIVLVILTNLNLVSSSRLKVCIRVVAVQGMLLGLIPLLMGNIHVSLRIVMLSGITMVIKGMIFPWLLLRALRSANVRREMEPLVDYTTSMLIAVGLLAVVIWIGKQLPLPVASQSPMIAPLSLFTIMIGLFMIVSRRKALSQVLGYLVMENGIYAFGLVFAQNEPLLVEIGTLLDVFMAVFIMGITIFHINREFDHIDADRLSALRD
jgi:hydrogenase-4 component E